jgi:hypothetical protein
MNNRIDPRQLVESGDLGFSDDFKVEILKELEKNKLVGESGVTGFELF